MPKQRIFISGVAGFLGSHLADAFLADGHEVIGNDNIRNGNQDREPRIGKRGAKPREAEGEDAGANEVEDPERCVLPLQDHDHGTEARIALADHLGEAVVVQKSEQRPVGRPVGPDLPPEANEQGEQNHGNNEKKPGAPICIVAVPEQGAEGEN